MCKVCPACFSWIPPRGSHHFSFTARQGGPPHHSVPRVLLDWALCVRCEGTHATKAASIGMTLGGLLSSSLAIVQEAGAEPRFSVQSFLMLAAAGQLLCLCVVASIVGSADVSEAPVPSALPMVPADSDADGGGGGEVKAGKAGAHAQTVPTKLFGAIIFVVYAATYTKPSLQPYMVRGYVEGRPGDPQGLLRWMNWCKDLGDVSLIPFDPLRLEAQPIPSPRRRPIHSHLWPL